VLRVRFVKYYYEDKQCTYNVTLRRIHETIVAVEKQHIGLCVHACVCVRACGYPGAWACACELRAYGLAIHLWPLCLHHIFRHYLINGAIFGKKLLKIKCMFSFSLQLLSKTFLILRRI
jgi:hypothetical protein